MRGWIRGNTKIGPVLDLTVCFDQGRYGIEIMIESLFQNRTVSWVRIANGINKFVTETSEERPLQALRTDVQGNISRRLNHDQSLL